MLLALDCSQNYGSLALMESGELIYSSYFDVRITHSETLLPSLDYALKLVGKRPAELTAIILSNGPGSFTGLRIGLATAKGLALGLEIPIYTYDSLQMMAVSALGMNAPVLVTVDARMKEIYLGLYDAQLNQLISPCMMKAQDVAAMELEQPVLLGSAADQVKPYLAQAGISFSSLDYLHNIPTAANLFTLHHLFPQNQGYDFEQIAALEPFYLRESTAQIRKAVT